MWLVRWKIAAQVQDILRLVEMALLTKLMSSSDNFKQTQVIEREGQIYTLFKSLAKFIN